jgi:hypothetical protein
VGLRAIDFSHDDDEPLGQALSILPRTRDYGCWCQPAEERCGAFRGWFVRHHDHREGSEGRRQVRKLIILVVVLLLAGCYNRFDLPDGSYRQGSGRTAREAPCKDGFKKIHFGSKPKTWYCVPREK